MKQAILAIVSGTFGAIIVYTLVTNGKGSASVIGAAGSAYATGVQAFTAPARVGNNARK